MSKAIGIDLGTTNSCAAVVNISGQPEMVINKEGNRITPSVVSFNKDNEKLIGASAKRQAILNPDRTIYSIKRKMGTRDKIKIDDKSYSPEEISAMILQKIKTDVEDYLGEPVTKAVITVPAYFNDQQRTATKQAGEIAGLEVLRIINEPTAAALSYGNSLDKKESVLLVYDLGGGTFDVSLLELEITDDEERDTYHVLATSGDTHLGGDDFDQRLMDYMISEFKKETSIDLSKDKQAMQRVKEAAEKTKCELSTSIQSNISLPFISSTPDGPVHLEMTITRAKFEELNDDLIQKTKIFIQQVLDDAKITKEKVDEVLLVGGSTRIPKVQEIIKEMIGKEPKKSVNPDEAVALGAAIQASVLSGGSTDILLLDVTPLSLGVETLGDIMDKIIERNSTIPIKTERIYSTASDFQANVEINVLQGERVKASQNLSLGKFMLDGIPPAPRGTPQIEVVFDIDANGIINVSANDKATGKSQQISITGSSQLSKEEVNRMVEDAKKYEEDDKKYKELIQTKNQAESLAIQLEKTMTDLAEKMSDSEKQQITEKIEAIKSSIETDDIQKMQSAMAEAQQAFSSISSKLYEQASNTTETKEKVDDDVIEGEFENI